MDRSGLARQMGLMGLAATGICSMLGAAINVVPLTPVGNLRRAVIEDPDGLGSQTGTIERRRMLKLIEDATGKTLAYSWAAVGSERIGLNTRWAQAGLTLQPGQPSFGFSPSPAGQ